MTAPSKAQRRVALVTGASSGIGASTAIALAQAGCDVALNYNKNHSGAQDAAQTCRSHGADTLIVPGDISSDDDCQSMTEAVIKKWDRLDVLINNAGITKFAEPHDLQSLTDIDFATIFSVNVAGTYQMTRAAAPALQLTQGAVVNISSHAGFSGIGSSIAYAASKGALNTLTLSLARTLAPTIRVNAVCPGFVDTDWMTSQYSADDLANFKSKIAAIAPLKKIVSPEDVAEAALWFALGGHSITGQLLVVDSGTHLTVGTPL